MRNEIDFMVVGIARCGTTTLFEHLRRHPQIFIPKYKECNFIAGESKQKYMRRHFPKNYKGKVIGAATPQWLKYSELLGLWFPNAKIIIMVRNPKDRTDSYIRMLKRKKESYDINEIKKESDYPYWVKIWKNLFNNVLVIHLDDMKNYEKETYLRICRFLNVDKYTPDSLGKKYNVGYDKMNPIQKFFKRSIIRHLIPKSIRRRVWFFFELISRQTHTEK